MSTHWMVLLVVVPLVAAPVCLLLHRPRWCWWFTIVVTGATSLIAIGLAAKLGPQASAIKYAIGGWAAPYGIEYRIDYLSAIMILLISGLSFLVALISYSSIKQEIGEKKLGLFYTAYLLCLTGMLGICITADAFNVFVFLEIASIASYILVSCGRERQALLAAFRYLIMGTVGATFILIGIGLLYVHTGTLNMDDLAKQLVAVKKVRTIHVAFAFITIGCALKFALLPFHLWLPNAYRYAPAIVSAFLAGTATKVGLYILLRFSYGVFGSQYSFGDLPLGPALLALGSVATVYGSYVALKQSELKSLLAWSSIAQIGYITIGIGLATHAGLHAGILHLINHALIKTSLFLLVCWALFLLHNTSFTAMRGLGQRSPWLAAGIVIATLSLVGMPFTAGFISKWVLFSAILAKAYWWLMVIVVISSLLTLAYAWKLIETIYIQTPENSKSIGATPLTVSVPVALFVLLNIYFGLETSLTNGWANAAAQHMMVSQ